MNKSLKIILIIFLVVDILILVIPKPKHRYQQRNFGFGRANIVRSYSETDVNILYIKSWAHLYLNPVGWYVAIFKKLDNTQLYQIERDSEGWKIALNIGRFIPMLIIFIYLGVTLNRKIEEKNNKHLDS